ncbi:EAL domain-containing protein [Vibrio sp. Of7-15]|uniref:EAL domain-containing protein n=1 Tax=Vibrio sp. Of7-15 TaxID=2724879 RepID=UPI001EF2DDFA|nr:EAL domain-containing protein [Vibrio sp. Of7-15]MCG7495545.1 EAL domain-containing protein [Vibrio sp. Of7-15]
MFCFTFHAKAELSGFELKVEYLDSTYVDTLEEALDSNLWVDKNQWQARFSDEAVWYRIKLDSSQLPVEPYLNYDDTYIDYIDIWQVNKSEQGHTTINYLKAGDKLPFDYRLIKGYTYSFPINIKYDNESWVYIKLSGASLKRPAFSIIDALQQEKDVNFTNKINVFLVGVFVSAVMFISTIVTREHFLTSFCYVALLAFIVSLSLTKSGFLFAEVWPQRPKINSYIIPYLSSFTVIMACVYTCLVLKLSWRNWLCKLLVLSSVFHIGVVVLTPIISYSALISLILLSISSTNLLILLGAMYMMMNGNKHAGLFFLGWSAYLVLGIVANASHMGFADKIQFVELFAPYSPILTVLILTISYSRIISFSVAEKVALEKQANRALKRYRSLYENSFDGFFTIDKNGEVLASNKTFKTLSGQPSMGKFNLRDVLRDSEINLTELFYNGKVNILELHSSSGEVRSIKVKVRSLADSSFFEGCAVDITEEVLINKRLEKLATTDELTQLSNRYSFMKTLEQRLSSQYTGKSALFYIDLDQFKLVNDVVGHNVGDDLIRQIAQVWQLSLQGDYTLARIGGDEFALLIKDVDRQKAVEIATMLNAQVKSLRFEYNGSSFSISSSTGIVLFSAGKLSQESLLAKADTACFSAKEQGRDSYIIIDADIEENNEQYEYMEKSIQVKQALQENRFTLFSQKIVSFECPDSLMLEVLIRMIDEHGELVSPAEFLGASERYGLMPDIDMYVATKLIDVFKYNRCIDDIERVGINISGQSLKDEVFRDRLFTLLMTQSVIPLNKICIEVTESVAITNLNDAATFLSDLKNKGVYISIDDFGAGYTSYQYLNKIPFDSIKIDGEFIKTMGHDPINMALVEATISIADSLNAKVVAEFVTDEVSYHRCQKMGMHYAQGYYLHQPEPMSQLLERHSLNSVKGLNELSSTRLVEQV